MAMEVNIWTPRGRRIERVTPAEFHNKVVNRLRDMVRETSYHLVKLEAGNVDGSLIADETFSRACCLRQMAVDALRDFDPDAEAFIHATYQPKQLLYA